MNLSQIILNCFYFFYTNNFTEKGDNHLCGETKSSKNIMLWVGDIMSNVVESYHVFSLIVL